MGSGLARKFLETAVKAGKSMSSRGHGVGSTFRIAVILGMLASTSSVAQDLRIVTFGGAGINGNYFSIAKAVCREINALEETDLHCSPEATPGSLYNVQAMEKGELDFALVQSDLQHSAVSGSGPFRETGPVSGLNGVMTLFQEALTFAVRRDAGIQSFDDIGGRIIDIGHPSTARRSTNQRLLDAMDFPEGHVEFREGQGRALIEWLCNGTVDGAMTVFGHPNPAIQKVLSDCDLVLAPVSGPRVDAFLEDNPDFTRFTIPVNTYVQMPEPVETFSVAATLMVREDIPDDVVELFVRTIVTQYDRLRDELPVLSSGDPLSWRSVGMTAPIHDAAEKVFSELEQ